MIIYSLDLLLFLSFTKLTNDSWVWGIFTSGSHALGICKCFVSTRNLGTKHHRLCHRVDQLVRCSAPRPPLLLRVCSAPPAVPFCVTQSTVVHSRVWLLDWGFLQVEGFWFSVVCGFKLSADSLFLDLRGFQEELWTFSWTLNIPKNSGVPGGWKSAIDGHSSLFWKSRLAT